uniref:DNA repair protein RadA n=1 Tax=Dialister sp. TaxID=1955814 RepID=UPI004025EC21
MAKNRTKFVCSNCGAETVRWMGRCPQCGSWNTLEETVEEVLPKQLRTTHEVVSSKRPQKLSEVNLENHERMQLSMPEVDRPLGGGVVPGSVILWGGEPGIGKSTLILQVCHAMAKAGRSVLYASGEESEAQIKMRAERLGAADDDLFVYSGGNLDAIVSEAEKEKPSMLVIDSIQTMYLSANESPMGSPAQIRDCTAVLVRLAKSENIAVMIIGHVTKEGNLAGPRILEHMVDVVFYLEGDRSYQFRVLRTVKNRFGSTAESGLFVMEGQGLKGIEDPSKYLLRDRTSQTPGQAVVACMEGLRPVLVEIQALTVHSVLAIPRRIAAGYDYNRMIILLAVLERRGRIPFSTEDVYLNVAGGFRVKETAADLAVALSLISVRGDVAVPQNLMALGEIGLTGEIMPVSRVTLRLKEALKMKFTHFILSERNKKEVLAYYEAHHLDEVREHTIFVRNLKDLMEAVK